MHKKTTQADLLSDDELMIAEGDRREPCRKGDKVPEPGRVR